MVKLEMEQTQILDTLIHWLILYYWVGGKFEHNPLFINEWTFRRMLSHLNWFTPIGGQPKSLLVILVFSVVICCLHATFSFLSYGPWGLWTMGL